MNSYILIRLVYIFIAVADFIQTRHLLSCFLFYRLPIGASLVTMSAALSYFFLFLSVLYNLSAYKGCPVAVGYVLSFFLVTSAHVADGFHYV